jgi:hypothetical protein
MAGVYFSLGGPCDTLKPGSRNIKKVWLVPLPLILIFTDISFNSPPNVAKNPGQAKALAI